MADKNWKLGDDLSVHDSLLDGIDISDLVLALHHTSTVNRKTAKECLTDMLESRLQDMYYIFEKNMDEIIAEAMKGRS